MPSESAKGKILVIRGGAIGDFILTLPVFSALREMFPKTEIHVLGYPKVTEVALYYGLVDDTRSIESRELAGFFARRATLNPEWIRYFESFSIIVSYLFDPDGIFQENIRSCGKFQFVQGPHRPDESHGVAASEVFLKPLQRLAIFGASPLPRLNLKKMAKQGENTLAIHPGSGSERKNWPEQQWAELIRNLVATTTHRFLLIGGEAEGQKLERLADHIGRDRVQLLFNKPLVEVTRQLAASQAFVGHDSGISHIAAAVGMPGLLLWGDSNLQIWRPPGPNIQILHARHGLDKLPVAEVLDAIAKLPLP
ncbi:MAG: lipopolysaccharide core biosynthesis protein [Verrucomicrobiales bacterium]|nr:lipopolysaccharide core biosynthesis protein [Verrucomicrobiales bacterium]